MKNLIVSFILSLLCINTPVILYSQSKPTQNNIYPAPAKYSISVTGGYSYTLSNANGELSSFNWYIDPATNKYVFSADNYAMQQGYGITATGKMNLNPSGKVRITGSLGYNLFYNTKDKGLNRTKWQLFNFGAGIEYCFMPKSKNKPFIGYEMNYTFMFGAWQTNITYPDNSVGNIYVKFKPESRLGMAVNTGMEFPISKRAGVILGLRGIWANITPKRNNFVSGYETNFNDSGNNNGINLQSPKQMIYMQIVGGFNFRLR